MPDAELPFGGFLDFLRIGLGFDLHTVFLGVDLKLVFLLMPDGESRTDEFAAEEREDEQRTYECNGPSGKSATAVKPFDQ